MGRSRVWAVVEGINHDTPYYESLLADGANVTDVEFVQASDFEVDGIAAGGKKHALKVLRALEDVGGLSYTNKETRVDVVVFVDRDDDVYAESLIIHDHLAYTVGSDVEADIVSQANLAAVVARTFSVSRAEASILAPESPIADLTNLWTWWIALRLASVHCAWSDTRFSQLSLVNERQYGEVLPEKVEQLSVRARKENPSWDSAVIDAVVYIEERKRCGETTGLVKGKWLAPYIIYRVRKGVSPGRLLPAVTYGQFITTCLMTIDFRTVWEDRYSEQLAYLVAT
jgi:hypothetical protein